MVEKRIEISRCFRVLGLEFKVSLRCRGGIRAGNVGTLIGAV